MAERDKTLVHTGQAVGWYRCDGKDCPVCGPNAQSILAEARAHKVWPASDTKTLRAFVLSLLPPETNGWPAYTWNNLRDEICANLDKALGGKP